MVNLIDRVNPKYQKAVDAAAGKQEKNQEAATSDATVKTENQDVYKPSEQKPTVEEDKGVSYRPNGKLVEQLKAEQEANQTRFVNMVKGMLEKQGKQVGTGTDDLWKLLASGDYSVDAETKAAAQEAIGEDGYWGVKQTSERIVGFAKALVGGDPARLGEMKDAFLKGYEAAEKSWGGELPSLTQKTKEAVMELFDQWEKEGKQDASETPETDKTKE